MPSPREKEITLGDKCDAGVPHDGSGTALDMILHKVRRFEPGVERDQVHAEGRER